MKFINQLKIFLILCLVLLPVSFVFAQESPTVTSTPVNSQATQDLQNKINELQGKVTELQGQEKTLSSQIAVMDNQIKLAEYQIQSVEEQITSISLDIDTANKKIDKLQSSLNTSIEALLNRIVATYQVGTIQPLGILLTSNNASDFLSRLNYLKRAQAHDKQLIYETQQAKVDYSNQKNIYEDKKKQIEKLKIQLVAYNAQLDQDKLSKQRILDETKGSEANYQRLLAEARAEYLQIQGIISGKGTEGEIGSVNKGDVIATVIQGQSCNSSGTHLHFTISKNGIAENPFNHLKAVDLVNDSNGDSANPSGGLDWPLDPTIMLYQGYGDTWYVRTYHFYNFHNGIDITGASSLVKAIKPGKLYQGSYSGSGGCSLRYVRVSQDDGFDTYYLHINYVR